MYIYIYYIYVCMYIYVIYICVYIIFTTRSQNRLTDFYRFFFRGIFEKLFKGLFRIQTSWLTPTFCSQFLSSEHLRKKFLHF